MLRLSELYTSVQGEGPNTGRPTQFVRFAGCNMKCPGWPCDTPYAIDPAIWRHDSQKIESGLHLVDMLPDWPRHLCLTGGEPFIQPAIDLQEFVQAAWNRGYTIECFSNGSVVYPLWARTHIQFMMDWKLPGSGEGDSFIEQRWENARRLEPRDGIKFVVKDFQDLTHARDITAMLHGDGIKHVQLWVGAAWGHITDQEIVEFITENQMDWRLNIQTHKYVWEPEEKGV